MTQMPTYREAYTKILTSRKKGGVVGSLSESVENVKIDPNHLRAFRRVAGHVDDGRIPATYPHVLIGALHAKLIARDDFPHPALGLVHVANQIRCYSALALDDRFDVTVAIDGQRDARKGIEFDLVTQFRRGKELVWEQITTVLRPGKTKLDGARESKTVEAQPHMLRSVALKVPEDMGRRYAAVSGDYNPIHLHALAAKPFGFRRAIATGMWTAARVVAELDRDIPDEAYEFDVAFRRPVYLPSRIVFEAWKDDANTLWRVVSPDAKTIHMTGAVRPITEKS
ncbi:MAG: MaoC/PaaZ C-terminal domain-containing protein [bacterium]